MLTIWMLVLCFSSASSTNECTFDKIEFIDVLELFYEKDILNVNEKSVSIQIANEIQDEFPIELGEELLIDSKRIKIKKDEKLESNWLSINRITNYSTVNNSILVRFRAGGGGYRYSGDILFKCKDGKYKVVDISYVSAIN